MFGDKNALWKHVFHHSNVITEKCFICNESYTNVSELKLHMYFAHRCFLCTCCYKVFHSLAEFLHHAQLHVTEVNIPRDDKGKMLIDVDPNNNKSKIKEALFPSESGPQTLFYISDKVSQEILEDHRLFRCYVCLKNIEGELTFIVHLKMHPEPRPLFCLLCMSKFNDCEELEVHLKNHFDDNSKDPSGGTDGNSEEEPIIYCTACCEVFDTTEEWANHQTVIYAREVKIQR